MKIYTNKEEYNYELKYWSDCCGTLLNPQTYRRINEEELPDELKNIWNNLWCGCTGSYCYLAEYKGKYGIVLVNEYYEFLEDGKTKDKNNYNRAVEVAKALEKKFANHTVLIGKAMGFQNAADEVEDYATELVIFMDANTTEEDFDNVADYLRIYAYVVDVA